MKTNSIFLVVMIVAAALLFGCAGQQGESKAPASAPNGAPAPVEVPKAQEPAAAPTPTPAPTPPAVAPAQAKACSDSDGDDITTKGKVVFNGKNYDDSCTSPTNVKEYVCQNDAAVPMVKQCLDGFSCSSGACNKIGQRCIDSEPEKNPERQGYVVVDDGTGNVDSAVRSDDRCIDNDTKLEEFFCDGNSAKSEIVACAAGCDRVTGACKPTAG